MDGGRIVAEGSPRELIAKYVTREVVEVRLDRGGDRGAAVKRLEPMGERIEALADRVIVYTHDGDAIANLVANDDFADASKTLVGPALGPWVQATGDWARLRSAGLGVEWSLPAIDGAHLFGGREVDGGSFDWAGLDYVFDGPFSGVSYRINVQAAR